PRHFLAAQRLRDTTTFTPAYTVQQSHHPPPNTSHTHGAADRPSPVIFILGLRKVSQKGSEYLRIAVAHLSTSCQEPTYPMPPIKAI
ncbi:hypothetical protein V496_08543, partial [Pseudogymnoascus sp. VKM F-4515 (FW-2607)]